MKKLLLLVSAVVVFSGLGSSYALDRTGKVGLGAQESFTTSGGFGSTRLGAWSVKYGLAHNMTGQLNIGFDYGNNAQNRMVEFGARFLYDLVEMENSDFYSGIGVAWNQDKASSPSTAAAAGDGRALRIQVPLGFEFSFAGLPEVGFSAEVGIVYDYFKGSKTHSVSSVGGNVGGNMGLGVHYYF